MTNPAPEVKLTKAQKRALTFLTENGPTHLFRASEPSPSFLNKLASMGLVTKGSHRDLGRIFSMVQYSISEAGRRALHSNGDDK